MEVEQTIDSHPGVLESAVVGVPDEKWGERPKAFVVLKPGVEVSEAELIAHVQSRIARFTRELERAVRRMANAYNRDRSDSQSDVFDVHYYAHVSIKTEDSRQTRQLLAAEQKIRAIWRRRAADHRASAAPGNFGDTDPGVSLRTRLRELAHTHRARQVARQS